MTDEPTSGVEAVLRQALEPFAEAGDMALISGRPPGEHVDADAFLRARAALATPPASPATEPVDELGRDDLKRRAKQMLNRNGWKPGDQFSAHSTVELMVSLATDALRNPVDKCGWPDCGCCHDASCDGAVHTPPATPSPAPAAVEGWRDISTVPEDGSLVLIGKKGNPDWPLRCRRRVDGRWRGHDGDEATHWMSLSAITEALANSAPAPSPASAAVDVEGLVARLVKPVTGESERHCFAIAMQERAEAATALATLAAERDEFAAHIHERDVYRLKLRATEARASALEVERDRLHSAVEHELLRAAVCLAVPEHKRDDAQFLNATISIGLGFVKAARAALSAKETTGD